MTHHTSAQRVMWATIGLQRRTFRRSRRGPGIPTHMAARTGSAAFRLAERNCDRADNRRLRRPRELAAHRSTHLSAQGIRNLLAVRREDQETDTADGNPSAACWLGCMLAGFGPPLPKKRRPMPIQAIRTWVIPPGTGSSRPPLTRPISAPTSSTHPPGRAEGGHRTARRTREHPWSRQATVRG